MTGPPDPDYRWMTPTDAAHHLGISLRELYRLVDRGRLPAYRIDGQIRLRRTEVERHGDESADGGEAPVG